MAACAVVGWVARVSMLAVLCEVHLSGEGIAVGVVESAVCVKGRSELGVFDNCPIRIEDRVRRTLGATMERIARPSTAER